MTVTETEFESLALTRRRVEEILNSDVPKEQKLNQLYAVVYDAWEHRLSCPDSEREEFDARFTQEDD